MLPSTEVVGSELFQTFISLNCDSKAGQNPATLEQITG